MSSVTRSLTRLPLASLLSSHPLVRHLRPPTVSPFIRSRQQLFQATVCIPLHTYTTSTPPEQESPLDILRRKIQEHSKLSAKDKKDFLAGLESLPLVPEGEIAISKEEYGQVRRMQLASVQVLLDNSKAYEKYSREREQERLKGEQYATVAGVIAIFTLAGGVLVTCGRAAMRFFGR